MLKSLIAASTMAALLALAPAAMAEEYRLQPNVPLTFSVGNDRIAEVMQIGPVCHLDAAVKRVDNNGTVTEVLSKVSMPLFGALAPFFYYPENDILGGTVIAIDCAEDNLVVRTNFQLE